MSTIGFLLLLLSFMSAFLFLPLSLVHLLCCTQSPEAAADNCPRPNQILSYLVLKYCYIVIVFANTAFIHSSVPTPLYLKLFFASFARLDKSSNSCRCLLPRALLLPLKHNLSGLYRCAYLGRAAVAFGSLKTKWCVHCSTVKWRVCNWWSSGTQYKKMPNTTDYVGVAFGFKTYWCPCVTGMCAKVLLHPKLMLWGRLSLLGVWYLYRMTKPYAGIYAWCRDPNAVMPPDGNIKLILFILLSLWSLHW